MIPVNHKTTVLFGHLCSSDLKSPKSGILNQFSCKISFRTLKRTSGTWIFQRLFRHTLLLQLIHISFDLLSVSALKLQHRPKHNITFLCNHTSAVSKLQFITAQFYNLTFTCKHCHRFQYILHLSAVGSCIHHTGTSDCPRNSGSKFKT